MFLAMFPLYCPTVLLTGGPGSLKDLLLATPDEAGLCDLGTRDLPVKGFLDLDLDSGTSEELPASCCSLESFRLTLDVMENLVIFLSVFFSMVEVFSWGELFPELED